ncbi:hypothetical protein [Undibacterium sp. WLX3042]|uniref:hypothetical protein n=1 Tax=Undibacterium sp. WLX3042 TaxID=3412686 RepID=UPI003C30DC79
MSLIQARGVGDKKMAKKNTGNDMQIKSEARSVTQVTMLFAAETRNGTQKNTPAAPRFAETTIIRPKHCQRATGIVSVNVAGFHSVQQKANRYHVARIYSATASTNHQWQIERTSIRLE